MQYKNFAFLLVFACVVFGGANVAEADGTMMESYYLGQAMNFNSSSVAGVKRISPSATETSSRLINYNEYLVLNNAYCYGCDTMPNDRGCVKKWELNYGDVMQTVYGDAYVCRDYNGATDKWENNGTVWCSDTQTRDLRVKGAEYCLFANGQKIGCRIYGDTTKLVDNNAHVGGCLRATLPPAPKKACDSKAHGSTEQGVPCKNIQNSTVCSRKCNDGTWNYTLTDCADYYHVVGQKCVQDTKYPGGPCTSDDLATVPWAGKASAGKYNNDLKCYATACNSGSWLAYKDGKSQGWCATDKDCGNDYKLEVKDGHAIIGSDNKVLCVKFAGECPDDMKPDNAYITELSWDNTTRTATCIVKSCTDPEKYDIKDNKCIEKVQPAETDTPSPTESNKNKDLQECSDAVKQGLVSELKIRIVKSGIENSDKYNVSEKNCYVHVCKDGFVTKVDEGVETCVAQSDNVDNSPSGVAVSENKQPENKKPQSDNVDNSSSGVAISDNKQPENKKPHSEEEIRELSQKADDARANEQLFANRMLSGATMAATGAGGQMLASALSEQKADEQAEQDMNAYLATFRCNYGPHRVQGGEQNIEIPGGNELINLYQQYITLANDLKVRKNTLGMRAGIESEPILDGATGGLYDDVGTGITGGAYASLARALMNPDGADAAKWAVQKEDTQKQLKTGAITAGVGAAAGLVGNLIINSDKAVDGRNAKRHCADAGGTWNEKTKKCTGADCGADMKWDDDKNSCVHIENLGAGTASVASAKSGADNSVEAKSSTQSS